MKKLNFKFFLVFLLPLSIFAQQLNYQTHTMEYDDLNRLERVVFSNGTIYEYSYDNLGNRTQRLVTEPVELTYVPDDNFEQELINLGYDDIMDDYVITDNINTITSIDLENLFISDATGIEDFDALEILNFEDNDLTIIDVSSNLNLIDLNITRNELTAVDVEVNSSLENLYCGGNDLTNLILPLNSSLILLWVNNANLTQIDISGQTNLVNFHCIDNQITSLDFSQNLNLEFVESRMNSLSSVNLLSNSQLDYFGCDLNNLSNLDITQNPNLRYLTCDDNQIDNLDLSQNTILESAFISSNNLTELDLSQNIQLEQLNLSDNNLSTLNFENNIDLLFANLENNNISNLDFSNNSNLMGIRVGSNNLLTLDVKNGNNSILERMWADDNPNLLCIQVDDVNDANSRICDQPNFTGWCKDVVADYSEDCGFLGTEENTLIGITLYPNPTDNNLFVSLQNYIGSNLTYTLFDINGRLIMNDSLSVNDSTLSIDVTNLTSGTYILKIVIDEGAWTSNFIKQ